MAIQLNDVELRVLGVMIEKALATPGSYPLTLNAILLGANQKQNREPVVEYAESDVAKAVHSLQTRNLVKLAPPATGARANRFQHNVVEVFHWDKREQAVMAELMLRGRQTPGELRTHASRMAPFDDLPAVLAVLDALSRTDPPYVEELPREPGRSANRFRHLLSAESRAALPAEALPVAAADRPVSPVPTPDAHDLLTRLSAMEGRISSLEARLAALEMDTPVLGRAGTDRPV